MNDRVDERQRDEAPAALAFLAQLHDRELGARADSLQQRGAERVADVLDVEERHHRGAEEFEAFEHLVITRCQQAHREPIVSLGDHVF